MFPHLPILLFLGLYQGIRVTGHQVDRSAIEWVDCSQNVPSTFNATGVDLANLPSTLHCGQIEVPMDYTKPLSASNMIMLGLAMYRPCEPKGVIFYNPGTSDPAAVVAWQVALNQTDTFSELTEFDLMMMDVRGTYSSNQLNVSLETFSGILGPYPTNQREYDAFQNSSATIIQSWIDYSSPPGIIQHVGSAEVVQDFEIIRKALRYEKIHFLGLSYGSYRAAQYASTFPERVGRFVLDAVTPHGLSVLDQAEDHIAAVNRAMLRADAYCQNDPTCSFQVQGEGSVPRAFRDVLSNAQRGPLNATRCTNSSGCFSSVTAWDVQQGMLNALLGYPDFPLIFQGLEMALSGDATFFAGGPLSDVTSVLTMPLLCNDYHIEDNTFVAFQKSLTKGLSNDPSMIGQTLAWTIFLWCSAWPFPTPPTKPLCTNTTMLLVTADFDVNTPTEWATVVRDQTPNSALVVRHGDDHVSFALANLSSTFLTTEYLRNGILPSPRNQTFVSVYSPGVERGVIADPYKVPTGAAAGDIDSTS